MDAVRFVFATELAPPLDLLERDFARGRVNEFVAQQEAWDLGDLMRSRCGSLTGENQTKAEVVAEVDSLLRARLDADAGAARRLVTTSALEGFISDR